MLLKGIACLALFVMVMTCGALVVPAACPTKVREEGAKTMDDATPVPDRGKF